LNTWGGYLKQYEVAINTQKLAAMKDRPDYSYRLGKKQQRFGRLVYIRKSKISPYFIRGEGLINFA